MGFCARDLTFVFSDAPFRQTSLRQTGSRALHGFGVGRHRLHAREDQPVNTKASSSNTFDCLKRRIKHILCRKRANPRPTPYHTGCSFFPRPTPINNLSCSQWRLPPPSTLPTGDGLRPPSVATVMATDACTGGWIPTPPCTNRP